MTVRTLVLLRHAKAEAPGEVPDHERALAASGVADAGAAGAWLAAQGLRPDLVFCSTARRTRQTWDGVAGVLGGEPEVRFEAGLYHGRRTEVVDLLRGVADTVGTVLVVGHNPTVSDMSLLLSPYRMDRDLKELKTTGLAVHRGEGPWSRTEPGSMDLVLEHTARA